MKIGIDAHNLEFEKTGVAYVLFNLLKEWGQAKNNNEYILYFKNKIPQNEILNNPKFTKKIIKNVFEIKSNAFWQHYTLPKALKKDKVDILFSPSYISPIFYKGKIAIVLHDICYEIYPEWFSPLNRILLKEISKKSAKKADSIFTVSEYSKSEIVKHYKVDEKKVHVAYNAADEQFKPIPNQKKLQKIKEKYKIKGKFIFFIGSIFNRRYIPELLLAFNKIRETHPEYQLLLVGRNHTYPHINIEKQIEDINKQYKETAVIHYCYIENDEDLNLLYNSASMTIYLSAYEGFGLPLIQSMACGTPVITNNDTSLAEIGNNAVLFVDPKVPSSIAEGIEKIISNKTLAKTLSEKGIQRAKDFSWKDSAEKILQIIKSS